MSKHVNDELWGSLYGKLGGQNQTIRLFEKYENVCPRYEDS